MKSTYEVSFPHHPHRPVRLAEGARLSEHLTIESSPVLFGCRTGICGTCMVEVEHDGDLPGPSLEEAEVLELLAEGNSRARLCCQLDLRADVRIVKVLGAS